MRKPLHGIMRNVALGVMTLVPAVAAGATLSVAPGSSIQQAIAAAVDGDVVALAAGDYVENLDFSGKAITVLGVGPASIVRGTGAGSVVRFASGEGRDSVLDSVTITGGLASEGGGIFIANSSPTIVRTVITANRALSSGSGVYVDGAAGGASPEIRNNLLTFNATGGGDPHSIQVRNAAPVIVNNTIYGGDSNGILLSGASAATIIMNNVIALNGTPNSSDRRGRGICDFSAGAFIQYNVFWRNRVSAILTRGRDFRSIRAAERILDAPGLASNSDRSPSFVNLDPRRGPIDLRFRSSSRIHDIGNPDPTYDDVDGTRNDPGHTGGPFAGPFAVQPSC